MLLKMARNTQGRARRCTYKIWRIASLPFGRPIASKNPNPPFYSTPISHFLRCVQIGAVQLNGLLVGKGVTISSFGQVRRRQPTNAADDGMNEPVICLLAALPTHCTCVGGHLMAISVFLSHRSRGGEKVQSKTPLVYAT
jgi:hypothetical protein